MPKKRGTSVFDLDRELGTDTPQKAAGPTLPKVSALPPPPGSPKPDAAPPQPPAAEKPGVTQGKADSSARSTSDSPRPRSRGGAATRTPGGSPTAQWPVRIPSSQYDQVIHLVKGARGLSWGQVVSLTCTGHPEAVRERAIKLMVDKARAPRGRSAAAESTVMINPRFLNDEAAPAEAVLRATAQEHGSTVTRTVIVRAALEVALQELGSAD